MKVRQGDDGYVYPYTSTDLVVDENGKSNTTKFNEIDAQFKDIAKQTITTEERTKLNNLENYDDTEIKNKLNEKANKNEIFTMANMGQDIKEAMTGGSVAVVGKNAVLTENIVDSQVIPEKTNFIDYVDSLNKNNNKNSIIGYYDNNGSFVNSVNYEHVEIKVNEGDTIHAINDNSVNYKTFVLLNTDKSILGVTSKDGAYPITRTYIKVDEVGYFYYTLIVPPGVNSIFYQYKTTIKNVADMVVLNEEMPKTYIPYNRTYSLNTNMINVNSSDFSKLASVSEIANSIISPIKDKKIGFLGDSFTEVDYFYGSKISKRTGSIAYNHGIQGSRVFVDNSWTSGGETVTALAFWKRIANMESDLDCICIFGGINDASSKKIYETNLGTIEDVALTQSNIESGIEPITFYSAYKTVVELLMNKYPKKKLLIIIPPHVLDASYEPTIKSYIGIKIINNAIREIAEYYGIKTCDLYENCQELNNFAGNVSTYRLATNNIHPNNAGQEAMSIPIQKSLESLFV